MIQYACHSEMFQSSVHPAVRCCSSSIYSLFTHSCQAVFSAMLRAQSSPLVTRRRSSSQASLLQCHTNYRMPHARTAHHKYSYTTEHTEWVDQLKIERDIVIICLVSRASHALQHVTVLWEVFAPRVALRPAEMKWIILYYSHASWWFWLAIIPISNINTIFPKLTSKLKNCGNISKKKARDTLNKTSRYSNLCGR